MSGMGQTRGNPAADPILRFGPFEVDLRAGELRKYRRRIRLPEQPFQILRMLLESRGSVVLRDEIRGSLWPDNTVVEFDHSINAAVKRLRDALRDTANKPRYIETVGRRGYRFICAVEPSVGDVAGTLDRALPVRIADAPAPSIAVLAFANMSGDKQSEYFSDGLAEEIINRLSDIPGLKVIARTSAFAFKGKQRDIRKIAEELDVNNILEGSVRREGNQIRVIAQLVAAADGSRIWCERYDRELAAVFVIQDEIAHAIASALKVRLSGVPGRYAPRLPAYEAYLKARYCINTFTRECLIQSREFYERAIALDPDFGAAQSGLAMSLVLSVLPGLSAADVAMPEARKWAERALTVDPASTDAQAVLGSVAALYDFDWNEAGRRFRLAMEREPVIGVVRSAYAFAYLLPTGKPLEAASECLRGLKDDPLNFSLRFRRAGALIAGGMVKAGEAELCELSEIHPSLYQPVYLLGLSQAVRGAHDQARASAEKAHSLGPWNSNSIGLFAGALSRTDHRVGPRNC